MTLRDALARIVPHLRGEVCVHANGYISRAGHAARDTDRCFYMIGSMGLASSIGLGLALAEPAKRIMSRRKIGDITVVLSYTIACRGNVTYTLVAAAAEDRSEDFMRTADAIRASFRFLDPE